ncbi:MAG: hypothetical protein CXR31_05380 [Geobacter sp.]|nr:MAG: hypothetical protein CXR31_05380 [Geobacter sp.]
MNSMKPAPVKGITYFTPPPATVISGLDGNVQITCGDVPLPLLDEDFAVMDGDGPTYDMVGRGVYHILRAAPDSPHCARYAEILRDAYPHHLSELATHIVMLDKKDVDIAYLDREINYLKIFALLEPDNPQLQYSIGNTYLEKGLMLSALHLATVTIFRAEKFLKRALELAPADAAILQKMGEFSYLVGRYEDAVRYWSEALRNQGDSPAGQSKSRLERVTAGVTPRIPVVDYLEAVRVALECLERKEAQEAAAILLDVLDDGVFCEEFPLAEIPYFLGICYRDMSMPDYAEEYLQGALSIDPAHADARRLLDEIHTNR